MIQLLSVIVYEYFTIKHIYMNTMLATQSDNTTTKYNCDLITALYVTLLITLMISQFESLH